ncbi:DUF1380 family protein (plasmid) [Escherichia coli]
MRRRRDDSEHANACRELAAQYPGDAPLCWSVWSPEEIQALLTERRFPSDHEIRTVLRAWRTSRKTSELSPVFLSAAAMEIISNVNETAQATVPAELLASLIQTAEQALWKREWAAGIMASPSRNASPAVRRWLTGPHPAEKQHTRKRLMSSPPAGGDSGRP